MAQKNDSAGEKELQIISARRKRHELPHAVKRALAILEQRHQELPARWASVRWRIMRGGNHNNLQLLTQDSEKLLRRQGGSSSTNPSLTSYNPLF